MFDLNKERDAFEEWLIKKFDLPPKSFSLDFKDEVYDSIPTQARWEAWKERAKVQAVSTWISVDDEWPPTDIMVLICWADAPDVTPEQDYMTIDEDLNSVWANYNNDAPSHWMHFHSVPNVSGAANE